MCYATKGWAILCGKPTFAGCLLKYHYGATDTRYKTSGILQNTEIHLAMIKDVEISQLEDASQRGHGRFCIDSETLSVTSASHELISENSIIVLQTWKALQMDKCFLFDMFMYWKDASFICRLL